MLAHVTDWNDAADEESAPFCCAKRGFAPDPAKGAQAPLESRHFGAFLGSCNKKKDDAFASSQIYFSLKMIVDGAF